MESNNIVAAYKVVDTCAAEFDAQTPYYYFTSNTVQSVIEDKSDGSTKQKELATATVKTYLVPIPPLMEQDRIISKIKQLASIMRG